MQDFLKLNKSVSFWKGFAKSMDAQNEIKIPEIPKDYTSLSNVWADVAKSIDEAMEKQETFRQWMKTNSPRHYQKGE